MIKSIAILIALILSIYAQTQPIVIDNVRTPAHQPMARIKLSIVPPADFIISHDGMGFFQNGTNPDEGGPQIRGLKYFVDFTSIKQSLAGEAGNGTVDDVRINNYEGIWIRKTETIDSRPVTSLALAFGNVNYAYVIIGFLPSADAVLERNISRAIQSAYVDTFGYNTMLLSGTARVRERHVSAMKSSQTAFAKKFTVDLTGTGFKKAEIVSDEHFIYSLDGAYPSVSTDKSFLQIKKTASTVSEPSYQEFSEQILGAYTEFNTVTSIRSVNVTTNGLKGIELSAEAKSADGQNVQVYQVTLFEADAVYVITGVSYKHDASMMEKFKTIASSFSRNN